MLLVFEENNVTPNNFKETKTDITELIKMAGQPSALSRNIISLDFIIGYIGG